jgi:hypothetical protein
LLEKGNEPFILTGVLLDDEEIVKIEGYFNYIKRKYGIDESKPFHSYHIYEEPKTKLPDDTLTKLSTSLADFISLIPIKVQFVRVNKQIFKKALGVTDDSELSGSKKRKEMREFPHRLMSATLFAWFAQYLHRKDKVGQIISDARRGGDAQFLKTLYLCKETKIPFKQGYADYIRDRLLAICFAEKGFLSGGVEITDLISYISFMRFRRLMTANSSKGVGKIWDSIASLKGITFNEIGEADVRRFFGIKKEGVHKYLK